MADTLFCGNYCENYSEKVWENIKSYSDFIKFLINKHCADGSYMYDDGDGRRGYFTHQNKVYTIRTWTVNDTPKGATAEYSIFMNDMTVEEAIKYRDEPLLKFKKKDDTVDVSDVKRPVKKVLAK